MTIRDAVREFEKHSTVSEKYPMRYTTVLSKETYAIVRNALIKKEPIPVGWHEEIYLGGEYKQPHCPKCESDIAVIKFGANAMKVSYCWACGQAIDWSVENDDQGSD